MGASVAASAVLNPMMGLFDKAFAAGDDVSGYKALVCINLYGGNDGLNWIVPLSAKSGGVSDYATYAASRASIAVPTSKLLQLGTGSGVAASDGNTYGIHSNCPELQALFNAGTMAILPGLGTLVHPVTKAQVQSGSVAVPNYLFSHYDQTNEWMSGLTDSPSQSIGWAGRMADLLQSQGANPLVPLNVSLAGNCLMQTGLETSGYAMSAGGPHAMQIGGGHDKSLPATFQKLVALGTNDTNAMVKTYANVHTQSAALVPVFSGALTNAHTFKTVFPPTPGDGPNGGLADQFLAVAKMISSQSMLRGARQVFFIQVNGFDSHANQKNMQEPNFTALSQLMSAFQAAMVEIGQDKNVTQFTMSDFGRSLGTNTDGTDHGWGNYHVVIGGSVRGGKLYGASPGLRLDGPNDMGNGRLIPTTSTDQYIATLMQWYGISASDANVLLPNLKNFTTNDQFNFKSPTNLGFLG